MVWALWLGRDHVCTIASCVPSFNFAWENPLPHALPYECVHRSQHQNNGDKMAEKVGHDVSQYFVYKDGRGLGTHCACTSHTFIFSDNHDRMIAKVNMSLNPHCLHHTHVLQKAGWIQCQAGQWDINETVETYGIHLLPNSDWGNEHTFWECLGRRCDILWMTGH